MCSIYYFRSDHSSKREVLLVSLTNKWRLRYVHRGSSLNNSEELKFVFAELSRPSPLLIARNIIWTFVDFQFRKFYQNSVQLFQQSRCIAAEDVFADLYVVSVLFCVHRDGVIIEIKWNLFQNIYLILTVHCADKRFDQVIKIARL